MENKDKFTLTIGGEDIFTINSNGSFINHKSDRLDKVSRLFVEYVKEEFLKINQEISNLKKKSNYFEEEYHSLRIKNGYLRNSKKESTDTSSNIKIIAVDNLLPWV